MEHSTCKQIRIYLIVLSILSGLWLAGCSRGNSLPKDTPAPTDSGEVSSEKDPKASPKAEQDHLPQQEELSEELPESLTRYPADYYIKWAVPQGYGPSAATLDAINRKLEEDGAGYGLNIVEVGGDQPLRKADADIAFTGFDYTEANTELRALEDGDFECLDAYLPGSVLYDAMPEILWDSVKYQGSIYYVPNEALQNTGICVLFNTDIIPLEEAMAFDGDIFSLDKYLSQGQSIYYCLDGFRYAEALGYIYDLGLLFSRDGEALNPLEEEVCVQWLRQLNLWYLNGKVMTDEDRRGECALQLIIDYDNEGDNYYKYSWKGSVCRRLNLSVGIRSTSKKKETAFRFLELIHTDPSYANLLVFGKEGMDSPRELRPNWINQLIYGLDTGLACADSNIRHFNTIEEKKQYYREQVIPSPSLHLEMPKECSELNSIILSYMTKTSFLQTRAFEKELARFREELKSPMDIVLNKIREQSR